MLIKQPTSCRKFCTLTLGGCPGPSTALQGELRLLSVQVGKKASVDGYELMEEKPAPTLGRRLLDGKEKTSGCCVEPPQLQARSWSIAGAYPLVESRCFICLIKCLALWVI